MTEYNQLGSGEGEMTFDGYLISNDHVTLHIYKDRSVCCTIRDRNHHRRRRLEEKIFLLKNVLVRCCC